MNTPNKIIKSPENMDKHVIAADDSLWLQMARVCFL